jgi:Transposase DDE domain group 1
MNAPCQQLSPHAGSATFWAFLRQSGWMGLLERCLPHPRPKSNNHLSPLSKAPGFVQGLLCGAKKFTHVAYLRRDPLVPEMLGIVRVASQSVLSRFFQGFSSAGRDLRCFRPLFGWALERLPSRPGGYALDLDSTRLLHEDGHQEGVAVGYTRLGTKPCLHPLLAVLSEVRLVAAFWLRAGNSGCANNVVGFFLDLWASRMLFSELAPSSARRSLPGLGQVGDDPTPGIRGRIPEARSCGTLLADVPARIGNIGSGERARYGTSRWRCSWAFPTIGQIAFA